MPFNYDSRQQYQGIDPRIIKGASKSPFQIAGETMTTLNDSIDNRAFEKTIGGAKSLEDLIGLTPRTKEQHALFATKQGAFNALKANELTQSGLNLKGDTLEETIRHNMATESAATKKKGYDLKHAPYGGAFTILNQDTGEYETHGGGSGSGIDPRLITLKTVNVIDDDGREVSVQVPHNKITGMPTGQQPIPQEDIKNETPIERAKRTGVSIKSPTVTQKDKDFVDNFNSLSPDFKEYADLLDFDANPDNKSLFGVADAVFDSTIGKFFQTKDAESAAIIDAMKSGMTQKVIKQFGSNPSDVDFKAISDQIPDRYDGPKTAQLKFKRFQKLYRDGQKKQLERLRKSNPEYVKSLNLGDEIIIGGDKIDNMFNSKNNIINKDNASQFGIKFNY